MKDDLQWKTPFGGRQPLVEDDLRWNATFVGKRPTVEENIQWKMNFVGSLHAAFEIIIYYHSIHYIEDDTKIKKTS